MTARQKMKTRSHGLLRGRSLGRIMTGGMVGAAVALTGVTVTSPAAEAAEPTGTSVTVSPNPAYASAPFQGWGTSLVWFANATGGYPDELREQLYNLLFSDSGGLGLTVARYNIGGGNASDVSNYLRPGGAVQGYWKQDPTGESGLYGSASTTYAKKLAIRAKFNATNDAYYDWSKDATQRWWLEKLAKGGTLTGLEAFANSAPWFMTESGYTSGGFKSTDQQLSSDAATSYVQYLVKVTQHLENEYGVKFDTLDAFNEPNTDYWGTGLNNGQPSARQEGMHVGSGQQQTVVGLLQTALKNVGSDTKISAMDETNTQKFVQNWQAYSADARSAVSQLNSHSYWAPSATTVRNLARSQDKPLWMSEVEGNWDTSGFNPSSMANALGFAGKITDDLNGFQPNAWVLWQPVEDYYNMEESEKLNWGEIDIDFDCQYYDTTTNAALGTSSTAPDGHTAAFLSARRVADNGGKAAGVDPCAIKLNSKFNALRNFTTFIRPGDSMVPTNDKSSVAAIGQNGTTATVVHTNSSNSSQAVTVDLSKFATVGTGATATAYVTTQPNSADGTPSEILKTGIVKQAAVGVNASSKSVTLTVPAQSVTTIVVDGVSGASADAGIADGSTYQLVGTQSSLALSSTAVAKNGSTPASVASLQQSATTADSAKTQAWTFHLAKTSAVSGAKSYILTDGEGKVLTASAASYAKGGGTLALSSEGLDAAKSDPAALWIVGTTDGSTLTLTNTATASNLDVYGQSTKPDAAVDVWETSGGDNQNWNVRSTVPTSTTQVTLATPAGTPPELPDTVEALYAGGNGSPATVVWDAQPASTWVTPGTVMVNGTATDIFGNRVPATAKVVVGSYAVADPTSITVSAGASLAEVKADAPTEVSARVGLDPSTAFQTAVTWDWSKLSDTSFTSSGVISVPGEAVSNEKAGKPLPVTMNVIVVEGALSSSNLCSAGNAVKVSADYTEGSNSPGNTCDGSTSTDKVWSDWVNGGRSSNNLTYTLAKTNQISSVSVLPFERAPLSVTVQYQDEKGEWHNTSAGTVTGLTTGTATSISFKAVTTSAIRLKLDENYYSKIVEVTINTAATSSDVATLSALRTGVIGIDGFASDTLTYAVDAPATGSLPTIVAIPTDSNATVKVTQPTREDPRGLVKVTAADGTTTKTYTVDFLDVTAPTVSLSVAPSAADGANGWYVTAPVVTASAEDNLSSAPTISYRIIPTGTSVDSIPWSTYADAVTLPEGESTVEVRATDGAKNTSETKSLTVKVDTVAPVVSSKITDRTVSLSVKDANPSVVQYSMDGKSWIGYTGPFTVSDAKSTISFRAVDVAGNVSATQSLNVPAVTPPSTPPTPAPSGTAPATGGHPSGSAASPTLGASGLASTGASNIGIVGLVGLLLLAVGATLVSRRRSEG